MESFDRCGSRALSSAGAIAVRGSSPHRVLVDSATNASITSASVPSGPSFRLRARIFACSKHHPSSRGTVIVRVRSSSSTSGDSQLSAPRRSSDTSTFICLTVRCVASVSQKSASPGVATVATTAAMLQLSEPESSASASAGSASSRHAKPRAFCVQLGDRSHRSSAYDSIDENPSA
jgi:hypothetical protein